MKDSISLDSIHINHINLWAHVGVLEKERLTGQPFLLDIILWVDMEKVSKNDELSSTFDYSLAVKSVQELSFKVECKTIEQFSELIFNKLESLYGSIPMQIVLKKCFPPMDGFSGSVSVSRKRNIS